MAQVQQVIEAVADGNGLCEAAWNVPVGQPMRITRLSAVGDTLVLPPDPEEASQVYRGVWNGDGPVLYAADFAASSALPAGLSGPGSRVSMDTTLVGPSGFRPPFTYAWKLPTTGGALRVDPAAIPALQGKVVTKVTGWMETKFASGTGNSLHYVRSAVKIDGGNAWRSALSSGYNNGYRLLAWEEAEARPAGSTSPIDFTQSVVAYDNWATPEIAPPGDLVLYIAGIKVYGKGIEDQYQLNDTVSHLGYIYVCRQTNTASVPGTDGTWERIAGTRSATGLPILNVYRNGTLVDSTGNANSDLSECNLELNPGDLIRAVWSKCSGGARMRLAMDGETA